MGLWSHGPWGWGWGLDFGYLGRGTETETYTVSGRDGEPTVFSNRWRRNLWSLSLAATRSLGADSETEPYLLAGVGGCALQESLQSTRTPAVPNPDTPGQISERSWGIVPGLGVGGGGLWTVGKRVSMGLESRLHLLLGAGDHSVLPILSVGLTVRFNGT